MCYVIIIILKGNFFNLLSLWLRGSKTIFWTSTLTFFFLAFSLVPFLAAIPLQGCNVFAATRVGLSKQPTRPLPHKAPAIFLVSKPVENCKSYNMHIIMCYISTSTMKYLS
jgi:hypothetical protein